MLPNVWSYKATKKTQNNIAHMDVIYNVHTKLILLFKYNLSLKANDSI